MTARAIGVLPPMVRGVITDPDWVARFLDQMEGSACESVWTVEHVVVADSYTPLYPYSKDGRMPTGPDTEMPDPLEWLAFAAGRTRRIRLGTAVVIASQHSAAILAKRVATLDRLSGGRVLLGVGLGWQKEEYEAIGVPYRQRGRRLDETIEAMRALWGPGPSTYRGEFVRFERVHCDPKPVQPGGVPIVVGGSSEHAARRAGRLGQGFFPFVISPEDLAKRLETLRAAAREAGRDPQAIELTVWPGSYEPRGTFDIALVRAYADLGARRFLVSPWDARGNEPEKFRTLVDRYRDEVIAKL